MSLFLLSQVIVVTGPPGAGKGVVGKVAEELGIHVLSTQKVLWNHGDQAVRNAIQNGEVLPDSVVCPILVQEIMSQRDKHECLLIDTVRSTIQCKEVLWEFLAKEMMMPITPIHLEVDDENALKRMRGRGRKDDHKAEERLRKYHEYGGAVLGWMSDHLTVQTINAKLPEEKVAENAERMLKLEMSYRQAIVVPAALRPNGPYQTLSKTEAVSA